MSNNTPYYIWVLDAGDDTVRRITVDGAVAEDSEAVEELLTETYEYSLGDIEYMVSKQRTFEEN